jgi:hypothetical protein
MHAGIREALADLLALVLAQRWLNAVLVSGAQLDGGEAGALAGLQHGWQVPGGGHVVGDQSEAERRLLVIQQGGAGRMG